MAKFKLFLLFLLFFALFGFFQNASADTRTALSCSQADVTAAYAAAGAGDTVSIPAGSCTWTSALTVAKAVTIQGAGSSSTIITNGGTNIIAISPSSDLPIRVTGIAFELGISSSRKAITITSPGTLNLSRIRIDHNKFTGGERLIYIGRWVYGVIDNNSFINNLSPFYIFGDNDRAWARAYSAGGIYAGTGDALFIEENEFSKTSALNGENIDSDVYIQEGMSVVVRYNTWDTTGLTSPSYMTLILNNHANQGYFGQTGWGGGQGMRGSPIFEAYNNVATVYRTNEFMGIRGGSVLIHDNTFAATTSLRRIQFSEEEQSNSSFFPYFRSDWPGQDQVMNAFLWNNTYNGAAITDVTIDPGYNPAPQNFYQKDRDYFMHAPCGGAESVDAFGNPCTHGKASYTGTRYGGSTTYPTDGSVLTYSLKLDTGSLVFSASGDNAYYPYTPYTYPHPLRNEGGGGGDTTPPGAPSGLSVI